MGKIHLVVIVLVFICFTAAQLRVDQNRIHRRLERIKKIGLNDKGGVDRVAYSEADIKARRYVIELMNQAQLTVTVDTAGNIHGTRPGTEDLPPIGFGSHVDSVPNGGNYDGPVGVIGAIEVIEILNENNRKTRHPLEVIVFSNEKGGMVGSLSMTGTFEEEKLDLVTASGKTIRQGIVDIGGDPNNLAAAKKKKGDYSAFIELHVEQGAQLHRGNLDIGVVKGVACIQWWQVIVNGFENHAGTTRMDDRQDALISAAHFIIESNKIIKSVQGGVGTVGYIDAEPGAPNVIPGKVTMTLELRDEEDDILDDVFKRIKAKTKEIEQLTSTTIEFKELMHHIPAVHSDNRIVTHVWEAATELGYTSMLLASHASHDAQIMAQIAPMGMVFVPSIEGISHAPGEYSNQKDIANGANVLLHSIVKMDYENFSLPEPKRVEL